MSWLNKMIVAGLFASSATATAVNFTELEERGNLDFDSDGCYNVPAIGADGFLNPGMECTQSPQGGCRDERDLDNNQVYSRSRCNNGWCAHLYAYYFEKDFDKCSDPWSGHKHDWEHIVVWTSGDQPKYVGVSEHGNYLIRRWKEVRSDGNHAKVVYHMGGAMGTRTHSLRFANSEDDKKLENHKKRWFAGTLISYFGFPSVDLRNKMMRNNWGSASIDIRDANIETALAKSQREIQWLEGDGSIGKFKPGQDAPDGHNSPGRINGCGSW